MFHYGVAHKGLRLKAGMVITIEPMVNAGGDWEINTEVVPETGWEYYVSGDGNCQHSMSIQLRLPMTGLRF